MPIDEAGGRPTCYRCFRPQLRCVCGLVPKVENQTPVLIVQHPRERLHPFGTATLAALSLARVEVQVVRPRGGSGPTVRFEPGDRLLFPDLSAPRLDELAVAPSRLVVIDGTWAHARRLLQDVPGLDALPRAKLAPSAPSRYRIRREPAAECLSSVESVVAALQMLEPETAGFAELLAGFDSMNDRQLELFAARRDGPGGGRRRTRVRPSRALPSVLSTPERCVVAYGESAAPPAGARGNRRRFRRPVHWVAVGLASKDRFERVIRDGLRPSDWHLAHMGLDRDLLDRGVELGRARADWQNFVGDRTVLTWNRSSLDLAEAMGSVGGILLKGVYCSVAQQSCGTLEEATSRIGLGPVELPFRGRACERIAHGVAIARWLCEQV